MSSWDIRLKALLSKEGWRAVGVVCAGLLLVEVNVLSSRHYVRWDASEGKRYSLSEPTKDVLTRLDERVEVIVLLSAGDPLLPEIRQTLTAYEALTPLLEIRYIDPDRDTAEFLALGRKYDIGSESDQEGGVIAETALLLRSENRTWFVRGRRLSEIDAEGRLRLLLEARLTEGIAQVQGSEDASICFVTGHGELSIDDAAQEGLLELRRRLERSNIEPRRVPLDVPDPKKALDDCDAVAVVGPQRPFPSTHAEAILERFKGGADVALFLDPIVDPEGQIVSAGLEPVLTALGVEAAPTFILEHSTERRLPTGMGEAFFVEAKTHPATRGLTTESARTDSRAIAIAAQSLGKLPGSPVASLLETSDQAIVIGDLNRAEDSEDQGTRILAFAGQAPRKEGRPQRWLVMGTSNFVANPSFLEPSFFGNQVLAEGSFSWLLERQQLVSVPERPPLQAGLSLTEESLAQLLRYVLIYMPLTAAFAGGFLLVRRRRTQDRSHPGREPERT